MNNYTTPTTPLSMDYQSPDGRKPITLVAGLQLALCLIPILIQGSLLHPKFARWRILRWLRLALTPLNVYLGLKAPLEYVFTPLSGCGGYNFCLCIWGTQLALKAIQLGLVGGFMEGRCWTREEAALTASEKAYTIHAEPKQDYSWKEVAQWTLKHTLSPRGVQYGWGLKSELNHRTFGEVLKRWYKVHLLSLISTGYCVACRDYGSPTNVLVALGFPRTRATTILAEGLASLGLPAFLLAWFDIGYTGITLNAYLVSWLHREKGLPIPEWIMEWFDTRLYTPIFQSPHTVKSLNELWSKGWHQFLRADLVFFGARPVISLAKKAGLSKNAQKLCSLFAVFIMSGVLHEIYILSAISTKISLWKYLSANPFPGTMFFFVIQPIGILVEPYIIPLIPKIIGGGSVWVWAFSTVMITPYRKALMGPYGAIDQALPPISQWPIYSFLIPGTLYRTPFLL
ncbi:hypothetical protein MJO28_008532 [Puccinia striiformis f. sp. tritici]|uniref:Wax synthase domain-containing protein n=2 Tax=Puccinia striiformis f. sp. tritici TaxID=168172 RepID=A0A0L0VGQ3_9BASI|nr:hypothetical protein Pst134EB_016507 [Puccinia striiformis f. sp. tritici]KAI7949711.1 hypothetical protein MJO28_008532 [Puccinia striiformis f. sp. tritici]KAI7952798.1 hypothetical protein MJO29_008429 [Puccinia striiformis f. sp. tritici]KAI9604633.1 hypothetical protein KEM48_002388 [Puccinia striiformis f. sp. tritici PST-130]KNE98189.1 hypothetical protein PSTG_08456 [Puccinia striiformis f. sp. tritici PST-78]